LFGGIGKAWLEGLLGVEGRRKERTIRVRLSEVNKNE